MTDSNLNPNNGDECCLPDIRISELPRYTDQINPQDLLVIDKRAEDTGIYETYAISWGNVIGIGDGGGDGDGDGDGIIIPNPDFDIILNGTVKFLDGTELRPSITFIFDDNTGLYRPDDNTIGFTTGGTRVVVMKDDYVGIGTDFPKHKLHVEEGNIYVKLGMDTCSGGDNTLFLGSSNRTLGGDPSIQSLGCHDLSFHVDSKEYFRINVNGAWGLREDKADTAPTEDYGDLHHVLVSRGEGNTPQWTNKAELWDLDVIIGEIDANYIGKGELVIYYTEADQVTTDVHGLTMKSGIISTLRPHVTDDALGNPVSTDPNANSFGECGWEVTVDETVVRTDGEQWIKNKKHIGDDGTVLNTAPKEGYIEVDSNMGHINLSNGGGLYTNDGGIIHIIEGGVQKLFNKAEFQFDLLDHISAAP